MFLHGFGGSCATYNAFLSELANHYDVLAFDMLGAGCSSKPSFDYVKMNAAQVLDLYVECIDSWIKALELDNFHMVGHSLGAYFGTFYLHRHTDKKVLSFVSVAGAGMTEEPENFAQDLKTEKLPFKRKAMKWFWTFMNKGYIKGHTAFSLMPLEWIISKWTEGRINVEGEEKKAMVKFIATMFWDKGYHADIVTRIFGYRAYALNPITAIIEEVEQRVKVMHIYGENDWMDKKSFRQFVEQSRPLLLDQLKSLIVVMLDTGHQIPNMNHKELIEQVNSFISSLG